MCESRKAFKAKEDMDGDADHDAVIDMRQSAISR